MNFDPDKTHRYLVRNYLFLLQLKLKVDTPLFATNANPLQLYHSPRAKLLAFKDGKIFQSKNSGPIMFQRVTHFKINLCYS